MTGATKCICERCGREICIVYKTFHPKVCSQCIAVDLAKYASSKRLT